MTGKNPQDGRSRAEEEADLLQVHLPWHGPPLAAGLVLRTADAAVQRPAAAVAEQGPAEGTALAAVAPVTGQEGGPAPGEARGGEDAPVGHDHPA